MVTGVRERGGALRLVPTKDAVAGTYDVVAKPVSKDAEAIMTDENPAYNFRLTQFKNVRHAQIMHKGRVYVKGDVHTNIVESAFSLLKRGLIGPFHQVSIKHLQCYLK